MSLRVVGAGLGRTGTKSLQIALQQLLGSPCYHMTEVFAHPEHVPSWHAAAEGKMPDWNALMEGYSAAVDWPASAFWAELAAANPDALILLSLRDSEAWWNSAHETIFAGIHKIPNQEWLEMIKALFTARFTPDIADRETCIAEFEKHNAHVLATAPKDRLLVWRATEGWAPICKALGLPIPETPFPRVNTREDWANMHKARAEEEALASQGTAAAGQST